MYRWQVVHPISSQDRLRPKEGVGQHGWLLLRSSDSRLAASVLIGPKDFVGSPVRRDAGGCLSYRRHETPPRSQGPHRPQHIRPNCYRRFSRSRRLLAAPAHRPGPGFVVYTRPRVISHPGSQRLAGGVHTATSCGTNRHPPVTSTFADSHSAGASFGLEPRRSVISPVSVSNRNHLESTVPMTR